MSENMLVFDRTKFNIARGRAGLTFKELSQVARCDANKLSGNKPLRLSPLTAGRVAKALNCDISDLTE